MIQLIVGKKGKGKTKHLLDKVNTQVKEVSGNIVYLDKSTKHMYELNNKVRLINVSDYMITNSNEFAGFLLGIISQDHDLQQVYLDSFLNIACLENNGDIDETVAKLNTISDGMKVLRMIVQLFREYKPLGFFTCIAALFGVTGIGMFIPVFIDYLNTGLVERFPTLIVAGFMVVAGLLFWMCGVILQVVVKKHKQLAEVLMNMQSSMNKRL